MEPRPASHAQVPDQTDFSGGVKEIMGRTPNWLVRWGMTGFGVVIATLLFVSWLIQYPDTIEAPIVVTGLNPPVGVVARKSGHLERLLVTEKQKVLKGDILAMIEGPADSTRVLQLRNRLIRLVPFITDTNAFVDFESAAETKLGQIQTSYANFNSNYTSYKSKLKDDHSANTLDNLQARIQQKTEQLRHLQAEADAVDRELVLAATRLQRMQALFRSESVSQLEVQTAEEEHLSKQRLSASVRSSLLEEEIALSSYQQQVREIEHSRSESLASLRRSLRESLKNLLSEIEVWESEYVLKAPVDGTVAFYEFWSDQQYVELGKEVFVIVPESSTLVGRMSVSEGGTGKVKQGQSVRVRFQDFPYKEFGVVHARVKAVSLVPRKGVHQVTVDLDYPLVSTYGKPLPFKQDMTGQGSIVTEDIRLIGRIFYELRKLFVQR